MAEKRSSLPWPVLRQLVGKDPLGRGKAVRSRRTDAVEPQGSGCVFARRIWGHE